jgi:hypothetical protein
MDYADYIPEVSVIHALDKKSKKLENPYIDKEDVLGMKRNSL